VRLHGPFKRIGREKNAFRRTKRVFPQKRRAAIRRFQSDIGVPNPLENIRYNGT
jgi:hypothetical protein